MVGAYVTSLAYGNIYPPILESIYNSSKHTKTGYGPFMFIYGFQPHVSQSMTTFHSNELQIHKTF